MAQSVLTSVIPTKDGCTFCFGGSDAGMLAMETGHVFKEMGYRLEEGTPTMGVYGKGSPLARILLGGLAKRSKVKVAISGPEGDVRMTISKAMSGWGGGAIGASAMKKDLQEVTSVLQVYFTPQPPAAGVQ